MEMFLSRTLLIILAREDPASLQDAEYVFLYIDSIYR